MFASENKTQNAVMRLSDNKVTTVATQSKPIICESKTVRILSFQTRPCPYISPEEIPMPPLEWS